jgi:hypothetical protein
VLQRQAQTKMRQLLSGTFYSADRFQIEQDKLFEYYLSWIDNSKQFKTDPIQRSQVPSGLL